MRPFDALSVCRSAELGETTIEQLALAASRCRHSMLEASAASRPSCGRPPSARGALAEFAALMARFRESAREAAVDGIAQGNREVIRYDEYLRAEGSRVSSASRT